MLHSPDTDGSVRAFGSGRGQVDKVNPGLGPKLISPKIVEELTSLKRRSIDRAVKAGRFPKPVRLSDGRIAYVEAEVLAWNAARVEERDSDTKAAPAPETGSNNQPASPAAPQRAHAARTPQPPSKRAPAKRVRGRTSPKQNVRRAAQQSAR